MFVLAVLPILVLAIVIGIVSCELFSNAMIKHVEMNLENHCKSVEKIYDKMYPGDYSIEIKNNGTQYNLNKGDFRISGDTQTLDSFKQAYGIDITIFCRDISVITTMTDANGQRYNLLDAPTRVVNDVLDNCEEHFYKNVNIGNDRYYAYYKPIVLSDGSVFGMISICMPAANVRKSVYSAVMPIVGVIVLAALIIGAISVCYSQQMVDRVGKIQKFMHTLAKGDFDAKMPDSLAETDDEIGDLAKSGKSMQHSLRQLVEYDALTQIHNRRYGTVKLKKAKEKASYSGSDYCVGICDIDFFKKVNDTYGHDAGDEVLKRTAKVLKKHLGGKGFVARWGGEEFLIVLEHTQLDEALKCINKLLDEIRAMEISYEDKIIKITMSVGIVQADSSQSEEVMLKMADDLLYYSKTHGRNQVSYEK